MAGTTIRLATPDDAMTIAEIVRRAYDGYVARIGRAPAPMLDDYSQLVEAGVVWVIEVDRTLAGLIVMWPRGDELSIDNLAVDPTHQGHGLASTLLDHAERTATAGGQHELALYTNEAMDQSLAMYHRLGFEETHRGTDAGYRRIYLRKRL